MLVLYRGQKAVVVDTTGFFSFIEMKGKVMKVATKNLEFIPKKSK